VIVRAFAGLLVAALISFIARKARSLTIGGAIVATLIGTVAVAAGWNWGALLIIYFASSTVLSRSGRSLKEQRTASIVAKGGERDAIQVLANGATFAGAAIAMLVRPDVRWVALGAGSLAAAAADTWATEIGTLYGGEPRSVVTGRRVTAGTSGGITPIGTLAAVSGAMFVATLAKLLGSTPAVARHIALGGVVGAMFDSLLGATVQARRWCDLCERETERMTHDCGTACQPRRGFAWLDNDLVNFLSNAAGGLLAALLSR
jgi:uncharacterized protein (TIGR00297 family)